MLLCSFNLLKTFISVHFLGRSGYTIILKNNILVKNDKAFICSGTAMNGLYLFFLDNYCINHSRLKTSKQVLAMKCMSPYSN